MTSANPFTNGFFDGAVARILELQRDDGAIPWFDGGVVDAWNHTEAAMGLATARHVEAAERAYAFLANSQLTDGSWWGQYGALIPIEDGRYVSGTEAKRIRDTNFCAYPATGVWHHYLITGDRKFLARYFPMVARAIDWVLTWQSEHGDVRWSASDPATPENDSLFAGNCSIYKSLESALRCAAALGRPNERWAIARAKLGAAIRDKPQRFDRTWGSKAHFAMDWYYPVLAGAIGGAGARDRIAARFDEFVVQGIGCRCLADVPWVTIAESAELALALALVARGPDAESLLAWQQRWRDDAGAYWMGHQYAEGLPWPAERPAWTAAAMILAADALAGATPAARLFLDVLPEAP